MRNRSKLVALFLVCIALLVVSEAPAQMAVVNSTDGYANVRMEGSSASAIVTPLQNNTVVIIDEIALEESPDANWLHVYFGRDPYCLDCTPVLSEHHVSGYIHRSLLKKIEELQPIASSIFRMTYTINAFNPSGKKIIYVESSPSIASINERAYFGSDCGIPITEITKAEAFVHNRVFSIPEDLLWSVLHAPDHFRCYKNEDTYFATQRIGDGACATDLVWVFDKNGLKQRLMGWGY